MVKRDIHNVIVPLDFTDVKDIEVVVETIQMFVQRKIPIRFGIVPILRSTEAERQARILYYMLDTYGLSTIMTYLKAVSRLDCNFCSSFNV